MNQKTKLKLIKNNINIGFIKSLLAVIVIVIYLSALNSCRKDETVKDEPILVESITIGTYTSQELQALLIVSGFDFPSSIIKYSVDVYKVTYLTNYKGSKLTASGIVVIPKTSDALSMISFQHGTIVAHKDAPSVQPLFSEQIILSSMLASLGFISVIPDYLGFGNTSFLLHPYYIEEYSASSVIDNLLAVKELAAIKKIRFDGNLFLAGYSQGGYVTMAAHKYIDQHGLQDFKLIASFPAAGGYDVKKMQEYLFGLQTYSDPYYIAYLTLAYKTTFGWTQALTDIFNEPYAGRIPGLFNGSLSGSQINAQLSDIIPALVKGELLANIDTDPKYQFMIDAQRENSLTDWVPVTPMYMYHGDADSTVPYQNSESVYQQLLVNGASADILHFIRLQGAGHSSGVKPYVEDVIRRIRILDMNANP